jgi:CHAT domain-containing protein
MGSFSKSEETIREYLLGRVSDETELEGLEDLLFTDEEFCSQVALVEDGLINDYVLGRLNQADAESFRTMLTDNPDRRFKLDLTQALREKALATNLKPAKVGSSFLASLTLLFRQPMYAGAFAVLLIAVIAFAVYLTRRTNPDQLAELRSIYQQARPTETRISTFDYAPLTQLRGAPEAGKQRRLRKIELSLLAATEKSPSAQTHHELGILHITQQKYEEAITDLESALKFADQNAQIHNDLGVAHFELAKAGKEKNLEELAQSLEDFTKATELDPSLLEALFNKSLALQEFGMPREAKASWTLYLQKDPSSPWADEARKHLAQIESEQRLFKSEDQVLSDFLTAHRDHDEARAQKIHYETKGLLRGITVPLQLSRRYLLAKQRGHEAEAKESIDALTYIGSFEQTQTGDSFFFELADFYANLSADKTAQLLRAKDTFAGGLRLIESDSEKARLEFEKSRDLFTQLDDPCEAALAENWAGQLLPDVAKISESRQRLAAIIAAAENRNFKVLLPPAYYWLGISKYHQNEISESNKDLKTALRLAEVGNNAFEIQHIQHALAGNYSKLGELDQALLYANKMLTGRGLYYQDPKQYWREKGRLAEIALKLKFFSTSLSLSAERLSFARKSEPDSSLVNDSLRFMVSAASGKGDFSAALNYANDSMQIALKRRDSAENIQTTARIYLLLADLKSKMKDCNGALPDYDKALDLISLLPEITDSLYQIHKGKLFCFQQLDRHEEFSSELTKVLALSEQYRTTIREDDSRQTFFASEQDVFDAATTNAIVGQDSKLAFGRVEASKARSLLDFVESGKSIAEVEKSFGPVSQPLSLREIQARMPEQVQLVQYAVLPEKLAIWIVSKTRFDLFEKQITAAELEDKIDAYQAAIVDQGPPATVKQAAQELYELLIPADLTGEKQLCLVPDKSLHQLSFATLVSPAGKYLLEDYALFYAPSASVLVLATENARRKEQVVNESLLSIGNPEFDREDNRNLPDLRAAETEAKAISGGYATPLGLFGGKATKANFLNDFTKVEVIHFAGHFVANRQSPGNSKLLLAGGDLRSSELSAYKLPKAKLVVLSACETGVERYNKGEGAIGIARTLLALGTPLVVASQWKVDSESTKDLMIGFHHNRKQKKMTSAESLRRAQLEVLSRDKTRAPFYWGAFSLFGGYANY